MTSPALRSHPFSTPPFFLPRTLGTTPLARTVINGSANSFPSLPLSHLLTQLLCQACHTIGPVQDPYDYYYLTRFYGVAVELRACSSRHNNGLGRRIHGSVEDTKLSTNKQHTLSLSALSYLLADYALSGAALTPLQHVSLILASDPRHHPSGQDRDQWTCELAPLAASFAIDLRNSSVTP
jgi:hypothetical protein